MIIGRHLSISHGLIEIPKYAHQIDANVVQIFSHNPNKFHERPVDEKIWREFNKELNKYKIKVVIHAPYTINLCHKKDSLKGLLSIKTMMVNLNAAELIHNHCIGVVVHLGKSLEKTKTKALNRFIENINYLSDKMRTIKIILETSSGQGSEIGWDLDELAYIYSNVNHNHVKICIDICHIWSAGYDVSTKNKVMRFFEYVSKIFGLNNIVCIHLNNSKFDLGSKKDRHSDLEEGKIPINGIKEIIKIANKYSIPLITETPLVNILYQDELKLIKKLIK
jgi:deoxyribonuclease-4